VRCPPSSWAPHRSASVHPHDPTLLPRAETGKPIGAWCPAPPLIGPIIFNALSSPSPLTVFPCRKSGNKIEANVNVNAKAQFESGYWRGVLDAQGKTDGGYY